MTIEINENRAVSLQASSQLYGEKEIYIQYLPMIKSGNEWVLDESQPNVTVELLAEGTTYDAYVAMSEAERMEYITTHLMG